MGTTRSRDEARLPAPWSRLGETLLPRRRRFAMPSLRRASNQVLRQATRVGSFAMMMLRFPLVSPWGLVPNPLCLNHSHMIWRETHPGELGIKISYDGGGERGKAWTKLTFRVLDVGVSSHVWWPHIMTSRHCPTVVRCLCLDIDRDRRDGGRRGRGS